MIDLENDYYLKADSLQFILVKKSIVEKGKHKGEIIETIIGNYPTSDMLFKKLFHSELFSYLKDDQINTFKELKKKFTELVDRIDKISTKIGNTKKIKEQIVD